MTYENVNESYGSFVPTAVEGNKIAYSGLSADISKLPKTNESLETGSTAYCIDTGVLYMYEKTSKTWYEQ